MRAISSIFFAALAACSGGEAIAPGVQSAAAVAPALLGEPSSAPASLAQGGVISLDDLAAEPEPALEPELAGASPLPAAIAKVLAAEFGQDLDPAHSLAIDLDPEPGAELSLLLGGASVMDAEALVPQIDPLAPAPELAPSPAALAESLR